MVTKTWTAIGLMSGTSMDGVDAAIISTDGETLDDLGPHLTLPYEPAFRERLRDLIAGKGDIGAVEEELTGYHARAVTVLLRSAGMNAKEIDVIGFHGHTILHNPDDGNTWQIGDGAKLAKETGIDVVFDLRAADVAAGGQGAPLAPVFHRALSGRMMRPLAVLNIGGVANVTWLGESGNSVLAFDTGPGGALLDEWAMRMAGKPFDEDGRLAKAGSVDIVALSKLLDDPYFALSPPKSLDRLDFDGAPAALLSPEDGAATLVAFTCEAVAASARHFPAPVCRWLVTGGGRRNPEIMAGLSERVGVPVEPVEAVGWDGDMLEAQAFAYLAVRSRRGLPLTLPETTGVREPLTGGRFYPAA